MAASTQPYIYGENMGTLRDEVYENLDYLSQLTEIVIAPQNLILGKVPDRFELTIEHIKQFKSDSWTRHPAFYINISSLLQNALLAKEDRGHVNDIQECFVFEASDDLEVDLLNNKLTGSLALVKKIHQLEEKKLLELAVNKSCRQLASHSWPGKRIREKTMTVLNAFEPGSGTEWAKKLNGSVAWSARHEIETTLTAAILENKWRIRDTSIIIKIGTWINSYLSDEGDASHGLVNLLKLRMMLNKDLPIYSVDEVKNAKPA